jgi:hypothetical protein
VIGGVDRGVAGDHGAVRNTHPSCHSPAPVNRRRRRQAQRPWNGRSERQC